MPHGIPQEIRSIHLMAICGTGMGSFAGLLKDSGYDVRGSDANVYPPMSTQLVAQGIRLQEGYKPENLDPRPDLVVVGNAIRRDNPESAAMVERDLAYASFPETLGALYLSKRHSIVVAGTHGKTTTTGLLAHALVAMDAKPSPGFLVGGVLRGWDRSFRGGDEGGFFAVEGDEYDTAWFDKGPKFLHYRPRSVILTSVEFDHADIYNDLEHVRTSFRRLMGIVPADGFVLACADGVEVPAIAAQTGARLEYYSTRADPRAAWRGRLLGADRDGMDFEVLRGGESVGRYRAPLVGEHNLANLTAVVAMLLHHGFEAASIDRALRAFSGVKRRQEVFAEPRGITLIDDFAHHPTAVRETIAATRLRFGSTRRLLTVFEPRTNTTRRNVFQADYGRAFDGSDLLIVAPVHAATNIPEAERFSVERLVADARSGGVDAVLAESVDDIVARLQARAVPDDIVLILSNGGFGGIYAKLPDALR